MTAETTLQWIRVSILVGALLTASLAVVEHLLSKRVNAPRPYVHPIRAGWSTDETVDVADFTVENDGGDIVEVPDPGVDGHYLVLWRADVDGGDFDFIDPGLQSLNQRRAFTDAASLTIDGVAGKAVRSARPLLRGTRTIAVDEPPNWPRRR